MTAPEHTPAAAAARSVGDAGEALLPCPFCGSVSVAPALQIEDAGYIGSVQCTNCWARGPRTYVGDWACVLVAAVKTDRNETGSFAWNHRLAQPQSGDVGAIADTLTASNILNAKAIGDLNGWCKRLQARIRALPNTDSPPQAEGSYIAAYEVGRDHAEAGAVERIRMAYKTGYNEGYTDATDDGTGNGYTDRDACEEGWQQYAKTIGADANAPQSPTTDAARRAALRQVRDQVVKQLVEDGRAKHNVLNTEQREAADDEARAFYRKVIDRFLDALAAGEAA